MQLFLTDQSHHFPTHLERLRQVPVMAYTPASLKETVSSCDLGPSAVVEQRARAALFSYAIFPRAIMTHLTEWAHLGRPMEADDTIVQQVHIPPFPMFSQKIVFGVRIKEVFNTPERSGFSYETLQGHVEKGISTFLLERQEDRSIFTIHTRSGAGNRLTALAGPIFSRPYQAYCTRRALKNMRALVDRTDQRSSTLRT